MYWVISVIVFFILPPVGAILLFAGIALNLVINLLDYLHVQKRKLEAKTEYPRHHRQYS